MAYRDPFSLRAEEIARQAILRADSLGMEHYGPAPAPLDEKRDMHQEAKLEDLRKRERESAPPVTGVQRSGPAKRRKSAEAVVEG